MKRRSFVTALPLIAAAATSAKAEPVAAGRLKQSLCRWCYSKVPIEDLCQAAVKLGIQAVDLVDPKEWPAVQKPDCS